MGGRREEGRRRSRRDLERAAGIIDAIKRGFLKLKPPLPGGGRRARRGRWGGTAACSFTFPPPVSRRPPPPPGGGGDFGNISCRKPKLPFPEFPSRKMCRRATRWTISSTASS